MIKSNSELRSKVFDDSIVSFAETTIRCIYSKELNKGYVRSNKELENS